MHALKMVAYGIIYLAGAPFWRTREPPCLFDDKHTIFIMNHYQ